ncbi:hypothetical protein SADUNF_Sadunf16G0013300 [Salix dunnii]|uniref:FAS1 domain-containing protein n=1 Tax=Salix dunnii TaxID=1413687 RepID=A0A835MFC7_9ROSI|nr:hypothetical protein SADUNF_Sadunf16G0013300 [Salix dunnii]
MARLVLSSKSYRDGMCNEPLATSCHVNSKMDGQGRAVSQSQPTSHTLILNDIEEAITDITSQNFFGFALLLQMLKGATVHKYQDLTFLVPIDQELTKHSISTGHLQEFLLNNSIPMPLSLSDLTHFPTGTLVPAGLDH